MDSPNQPETDWPHRYAHLAPVDRGLAHIGLRPRWTLYVLTSITLIIAWVWLSFLAAGVAGSAVDLGPGMALWQDLLARLQVNPDQNGFLALVLKLCTPQTIEGIGPGVFLSTLSMWFVMSLAMMLPSAAPMMRTYADIAEVASQKGEKVAPLYVLMMGYLCIWAAFSFAVTLFQLVIVQLGLAADPVLPIHGLLAGFILLLAGAYQFSALKNACLEKCRNPFAILFGRWSPKSSGIFKLGAEQGLFCLGCCWTLMLVMLVVGTMNLAWMAFFTLFAIVEKSGKGKVTSYLSGGILLVWGGILCLASLTTI